jgi:nucleoid-associated protein YgaU
VSGNLNPATAWVTYKAQFDDTYGTSGGEVSDVPAEWFEYMAHGAYADYLRAEGQQERAVIADQEADAILQDELMRLDEQHTQTLISNRMFTNSNMQVRY